MSEISNGSVSTMPGSSHALPDGTKCDECELPAVIRAQGETDSFGCEYYDICKSHYDEFKNQDVNGRCDWRKKDSEFLSPMRDDEEGMYGPVYHVCTPCRIKYRERIRQEMDDMDDYFCEDY